MLSELLKKKERGFTIIEVVIVLAIASLILLAVFLASAGAQRSQRDSARKSIAGRVGSGLENWASNNNGVYPAGGAALGGNYLAGIVDPDTNVIPVPGASATATSGVRYQARAVCPGSTVPAGPRTYAVFYWSENANAQQCTGS
jgi:prepilin-type N-terminal cleavage/methylation domain-containing protein